MASSIESNAESRFKLGIVVPLTKLSTNYKNLMSWLSQIPEGNIEVILVHDIQDEATGPVIKGALGQVSDRRIKYYEGVFGAPGLSRNFGMTAANADWLWFVDADDLPNIANVLSELRTVKLETEVLIGQFKIETTDGSSLAEISKQRALKDVARNPGIWRMIFRATNFSQHKFQEFRMAEDQLFLVDISLFQRKVQFSEFIFYSYFKHPYGQLTSQKSAILDLSKTIPLIIAKIQISEDVERKYLEIILARQLGTQLKHSGFFETLRNLQRNVSLAKNLSFGSRQRVSFELVRIIFYKFARARNE